MAEAKRFAMVCAANMNRSMEAHKVALNAGLDVKSYGAGNRVKLPGASRDNPNVFEFGSVTYKDIYDKLMAEVPKYKMISVSILTDRLRITCSLARKAIAILIAQGHIKPVTMHSKQQIYTRTTADE